MMVGGSYTIAVAVALLGALTCVSGLDNGAALLPPMGWSTWNKLRLNFNETILQDVGQAMIDAGMIEAGYEYLNIDDGWPLRSRDADGYIVEDPAKFPSGMKALGDWLHRNKMKLGIYTAHCSTTCQGFPGSVGYEQKDVDKYAYWGVEFVKNDWCSGRAGHPSCNDLEAFNAMRDAIAKSNQTMVHSIHWNYGVVPSPTGIIPLPETANMWRIGGDISANWESVKRLIATDLNLTAYAEPGAWNDADMMEVGNGMSDDEDRSHFSMWCILASPLIAGNDPRTMSTNTTAILTNKWAIAVNQDKMGVQGSNVNSTGGGQVWVKAMTGNAYAVVLLNPGEQDVDVGVSFSSFNASQSAYEVVDLWDGGASLGTYNATISATVGIHQCKFYLLRPPSWKEETLNSFDIDTLTDIPRPMYKGNVNWQALSVHGDN